jgi:hypothetical protein
MSETTPRAGARATGGGTLLRQARIPGRAPATASTGVRTGPGDPYDVIIDCYAAEVPV